MKLFYVMTLLLVVALAFLGASQIPFCPTLGPMVQNLTSWTEEARAENPLGYLKYAQSQLEEDGEKLEAARRDLRTELNEVDALLQKYDYELTGADQLAEEFRDAYQDAAMFGAFPIVVRDAAYTREQAELQVEMLLSERATVAANYQDFAELRRQVEQKLKSVNSQLEVTQAKLESLPATRALVEAGELEAHVNEVVGPLKKMLDDNQSVVRGNPVRSLDELSATPRTPAVASDRQAARNFLAGAR